MTGQSDSEPINTATQLILISIGFKGREYTRRVPVGQTLPTVIQPNHGSLLELKSLSLHVLHQSAEPLLPAALGRWSPDQTTPRDLPAGLFEPLTPLWAFLPPCSGH